MAGNFWKMIRGGCNVLQTRCVVGPQKPVASRATLPAGYRFIEEQTGSIFCPCSYLMFMFIPDNTAVLRSNTPVVEALFGVMLNALGGGAVTPVAT